MKEQIDKLLRLQLLDLRIRELGKDLEALPEERRAAEASLAEKKAERKALEKEIEEAKLARAASERNLESNTDQIKRYNRQLSEVKTNREYAALESQIETIRSANGDLEEKVLREMERIEELEARREKIGRGIEESGEELKRVLRRVEEEGKELGRLVEEARVEREGATAGMDRAVLSRYERIRGGKKGVAIARIDRDACEVCFRSIPPQRIIEVRKLKRIICCEGCGRILVWER